MNQYLNLNVHESKTIIEKRAPTDESVKLLHELEVAAENKIKAAIRLENCIIDCVIHKLYQHLSGDTHYIIHFRLNGKDFETRVECSEMQRARSGLSYIDQIVKHLSELIAVEVLMVGFNKIQDGTFFT